jgi:hypothetical protein
MSNPAEQNQAETSFAELLRETPREQGTVTVVGVLSHATKEGRFVLIGADGEAVEIPVEAVKHHHVVRRIPARVVVQVELDAALLESSIPKTILDKATKDPALDGRSPFGHGPGSKVTILERAGGGEGYPFPSTHALPKVFTEKPTKDVLLDTKNYQDLIHKTHKDPLVDHPGLEAVPQPPGGGWPPPPPGLWPPPKLVWLDAKHPWMEKVPFHDGAFHPQGYAEGPYAAGAVPFVLATPHHARQAVHAAGIPTKLPISS